mgnify:CR=1 FL=1
MSYPAAFSREAIDSEVLKPIPLHLHPWIKVDLREIAEKDIPKVKKDLREVERHRDEVKETLAGLRTGTVDYITVTKQLVDAEEGIVINRSKLEFYDGKTYLLTKRLALRE